MRQIVIDENVNFEALKEKIKDKLKLTPNQEVVRIAYRYPMRFSPLQFYIIQVEDDSDLDLIIETHKENVVVLQVIQLHVFVFDIVLVQQFSCPQEDPTMLPSYHITGRTDELAYLPNTGSLSLYSELVYQPNMEHQNLFREPGESSYQTTLAIRHDDDGDLPLDITHGNMIDDDVEDKEYVLQMDRADAITEDNEDDKLDSDNEANGREEDERNEAIMLDP